MKMNIKLILSLVVILSVGFIAACSDDDEGSNDANKDALNAAIVSAQALLDGTEEGTSDGQYISGSQADLQAAITAAATVANTNGLSQSAVNNAVTNLAAAVATYQGNLITPIAPGKLIAQWKFDEGTGTVAGDDSENNLDGTLTVGHVSLGGPVPSWSADRKGVASKALHFTKGGHIEVPSNAKFGPAELSISVWLKIDSLNTTDCNAFSDRCNNGTFKDNYILAQNSYNGYKFQTQDDRYPFMTVKKGTDSYIDQAANTNIPLKQWHHAVVTFKAGEMKFYLDGVDVSKNETITGTFITLSERFDFVIGAELPNAKVDPGISWVLPHFEGSMDELRMYSTVLTPAQVTQIYNIEK